ncbi:MAG: hypothetical protein ACQEXV_22535 [Bacillota bacterium]
MKNVKDIFAALRNITLGTNNEEVEAAQDLVSSIKRHYLAVSTLEGQFEEVYVPLSMVFSSLPRWELVEDAIMRNNYEPLKEWHEGELELERDPENYNHQAASMDIDEDRRNIVFYTGNSSRRVLIDSHLYVTCDFGQSVAAAHEVLMYIKHMHPETTAAYYSFSNEYCTHDVRDIELSRGELLFLNRGNSPEDNIAYHSDETEELGGVFRNHAPYWYIEEYDDRASLNHSKGKDELK